MVTPPGVHSIPSNRLGVHRKNLEVSRKLQNLSCLPWNPHITSPAVIFFWQGKKWNLLETLMIAVLFFHSAFLPQRGPLWPPSCAEQFLVSFLCENSCQLNDEALLIATFYKEGKSLLFLQLLQSRLNWFYPYFEKLCGSTHIESTNKCNNSFKNKTRDFAKILHRNIIVYIYWNCWNKSVLYLYKILLEIHSAPHVSSVPIDFS